MKYQQDDGGRAAAGYKGTARDCSVRAIAIALEYPYQAVYDTLNIHAEYEVVRGNKKKSSARTGMRMSILHAYLKALGWAWHPTMGIGTGCKVHLRDGELPMGRLIVRVSGHLAAVIDGVLHDNHDSSREGTRCVYGYWSKDTAPQGEGRD